MRRITAYIILSLGIIRGVHAQTSLSFYNLGNSTFQNSFYNPAYIPEGKVFVGLPVLSGVHVNVNNKFSYSELIVKGESQNQVDLRLLLDNLQRNNMSSVTTNISLLHFAVTTESRINFSLFANERIEVDFLYPKSLVQIAADGNASFAGETIKVGKTRLSAVHFREIGMGVSAPVSDIGLTVGLRAKYLQGFFNASTPLSIKADLTSSGEDYSLTLDMQNATLRTSGIGIAQGESGNLGSHLINNQNRGAAIDVGFHWEMDDYNSFSGSVTDLGFLSWKEDIKNYTMGDTTLSGYSGVDLKDPSNLEDQIKDSLINRFKDKLSNNTDPYSTMLSPKAFLSWTFHTPFGGDVISTLGTRYIQGQAKFLGGVGYRHSFGKIFTGTVNVTKLPQQFLNLGAAFTVNGGPAQFYLAVDQLVNYDATKFKAFDLRVGLNLVFGRRGEKEVESAFVNSGPSTSKNKGDKPGSQSFLGSKVRAKGKDGIYTIIPKQKRRDRKEYQTDPDNQ